MLSLFLCAVLLAPAVQDYSVLTAAEPEEARWTPVVGVVQAVAPAVVFIQSEHAIPRWFLRKGGPTTSVRSGSGVVIEKSGYIVTNFHVVGDAAARITVQFGSELNDPEIYAAELVSFRAEDDLALLKIDAPGELAVVRRGTSSDLWLGERVIVIGNPFQQKLSVTTGIISGLYRDLPIEISGGRTVRFSNLIQTDASINPGSSGGPWLNILGELIGITTAVNPGAENMGFAIPIDRIEEVLADHLLAPSASKAWLGFEVDEGDSFCITSVTPGGPAALAGIEEGDRLVGVQGQPIRNADDFRLQVLRLRPHQPIQLRVASQEQERELLVRGWDRADGILWERLGMTVEAFAIGRYRVVRVGRLDADGPAQHLGLEPRDVIDAVQIGARGQPWQIHGPDSLAALVGDQPPGTQLALDVFRDDDRNGELSRSEFYKGVLTLR